MILKCLIAWEQGGGYGHLARARLIGEALSRRGHRVTHAVPDPARAARMLAPARIVAAPVPVPVPRMPAEAPDFAPGFALDFAGVLLNLGYAEPGVPEALLDAWDQIFAAERPDLILADYAPGALLAAHAAGIPSVAFGSGFFPPPAVTPLPPLRSPTAPAPHESQAERRVGSSFRTVLATRRPVAPDWPLAALFRPAILCAIPELDPYPARAGAHYVGPIHTGDAGEAPSWPDGTGPRLFAYLQHDHPALPGLCDAAARGAARLLLHARRTSAPAAPFIADRPGVRLTGGPVRLAATLAECDAVVAQGTNTVIASVLAGRPVIALPMQVEQTMVRDRLVSHGLGVTTRHVGPASCARAIDAALQPAIIAAVKTFARAHETVTPGVSLEAFCRLIEQGLG